MQAAARCLRRSTYVVRFPGNRAGSPLSSSNQRSANERYRTSLGATASSLYSPFCSLMDWEFARWAKMRGPGSTAVSELLDIDGLAEKLGLSYKTVAELNAIIDKYLSSERPRFTRREIVVGGEAFEVFYRDVIACIRALFGDPEFSGILVFAPERHYTDDSRKMRVYFDMHTGKWWWDTQRAIEALHPGATIIPVIISSDKTQLTLFGSKAAYPVYLTIGNLPKDVRRKPSRRGQILLAYLPTTRLEHITNKAARRRMLINLYHACMSRILKPLKMAGIDGIVLASGDGVLRRGHPILAVHVGDYLEQVLVTGCKQGECPKCPVPTDQLGEFTQAHPLRDSGKVLEVLGDTDHLDARNFTRACQNVGIKPIRHPFWVDLPFVDIYRSITPDILHQLLQGVVKHLVVWLKKAYGADELDARCRRFPPNHNIRLFFKGITKLQRVTGGEHADMCRFILGLIIGLPLPGGLSPVRLLRAVRALLDFLYISQYPVHTTASLALLRDALSRFHANKAVFIVLGIRVDFNFPKLHSLEHYFLSIILFGTTDNYDTQFTERLHIDFAKEAYRATNHKNEYPQMTLWLERREKILRHEVFIRWPLHGPHTPDSRTVPQPSLTALRLTRIKMARYANVKALTFARASQDYGALFLSDALARFVVQYQHPWLSDADVEREAGFIDFHFRTFHAFHRMKFTLEDAQELGIMDAACDAAHARPERHDKQGRVVPARFDTVLVNEYGNGQQCGMLGYRVGRVRLIFQLPYKAAKKLFPHTVPPAHLAYIEWFTAFTQPHEHHGLYKVSRCRGRNGERLASVIELRHIRRSCHLLPDFGGPAPRDWSSSNVLDKCDNFWVNPFSDMHMYMTLV
ncbi:hypothetical protein C8Q78DRAFT_970055 [Trametes maxima]|nr:hypothetical protein C8Q78DRAFT_970055 [Trametes maxima]